MPPELCGDANVLAGFHGETDGNGEWRHKDCRWVATTELMGLVPLSLLDLL
jgi:hypothetical protein